MNDWTKNKIGYDFIVFFQRNLRPLLENDSAWGGVPHDWLAVAIDSTNLPFLIGDRSLLALAWKLLVIRGVE